MSGEQLASEAISKNSRTRSYTKSKKLKVNINDLLDKVREEKSKERKENYMFLGLVVGLLAVTGIIASL